ncbi:unnamed protein product [Amaranthus hypochondriacus]
MIGQKWGTVLEIENVYNGLNSITAARILVKTESLNRIHGSVEVEWKHGSYAVWVEEILNNKGMENQEYTSSDEEEDDETDKNSEENEDTEDTQVDNLNENGDYEHNVIVDLVENKNGDCVDKEDEEPNEETVEIIEEPTLNEDQRIDSLEPKLNFVAQNDELASQEFETQQDFESNEVVEVEQTVNGVLMKVTVINGGKNDQRIETHVSTDGLKVIKEIPDSHAPCLQKEKSIEETTGQQEFVRQELCEECVWVDRMNNNELEQPPQDRFDPISTLECFLAHPTEAEANNDTIPQRTKRGRPKRLAQSVPEPLYVPSTPPNSSLEAKDTWHTVRQIGVKSRNEKAMISAIRRSKRLLVMEETSH